MQDVKIPLFVNRKPKGFYCGALAALYAFIFIGVIIDMLTCKKITLFKDGV